MDYFENSIRGEIAQQSQNMGMDNFVCSTCKFYKGKLGFFEIDKL